MTLRAPPVGFVDLAQALPELRFDLGYATARNFTGAPLPGYGAPGSWLLAAAAESLGRVLTSLRTQHFGLVCFDAYRPDRAVQAMLAWAARTGQRRLVDEGYLSETSWHSAGLAIDVGLVALPSGNRLDLGTEWDTFSPASAADAGQGEARVLRSVLAGAFTEAGWRQARTEWWHFRYLGADGPRLDVPYGADEPL